MFCVAIKDNNSLITEQLHNLTTCFYYSEWDVNHLNCTWLLHSHCGTILQYAINIANAIKLLLESHMRHRLYLTTLTKLSWYLCCYLWVLSQFLCMQLSVWYFKGYQFHFSSSLLCSDMETWRSFKAISLVPFEFRWPLGGRKLKVD